MPHGAGGLAPNPSQPRSSLTPFERREAARLRLRNALERNDPDAALRVLLEHPAAARSEDPTTGRLPLRNAIEQGTVGIHPVVAHLLELFPEPACEPDAQDGKYALHVALANGASEYIVFELLQTFPDAASLPAVDGRSALAIALHSPKSTTAGIISQVRKRSRPRAPHATRSRSLPTRSRARMMQLCESSEGSATASYCVRASMCEL